MNWHNIDKQRDPQQYRKFLAAANGMSRILEYKQRMESLLELQPGMHVLDLGCGTGQDARAIAGIVGAHGRVVAADNSLAMLDQARQACRNLSNVEFAHTDAYSLPFADQTFDRTRVDRVLQHLRQPELVIAEMVRVTKVGGLVCCADPDWRTLVIDSGDADLEASVCRAVQARIQNAGMGARLKRLLCDQRLANVQLEGYTVIFESFREADAVLILRGACRTVVEVGKSSAGSARRWLKDLRLRDRNDQFFASLTGFCAVGTRQY
jgi:SAM-dependent methyltransferase